MEKRRRRRGRESDSEGRKRTDEKTDRGSQRTENDKEGGGRKTAFRQINAVLNQISHYFMPHLAE